MSPIYCLTLRPRSPWRTPWQADTLAGALLATCARVHGAALLRRRLIEPMLAAEPPFVLSDAVPGELLPLPVHLRLHRYLEGTDLKAVKRGRWLMPDAFARARSGAAPPPDALLPDSAVFQEDPRHHNTLSRLTDTSTREEADDKASAIGLFQKADTLLRPDSGAHLTLYFRFADPAAGDLLLELLYELSLTGFGADVSTGRGQFDIPADPVPVPALDASPPDANAVCSLSTFQPGPADPTDGRWEAFAKFPKLGPDLVAADFRKHTLILFRPGAVFRANPATPWLGHAIDTPHLFPKPTAEDLLARDLRVIHPAFGLMIPLIVPSQSTGPE
jgi:hypothetical protein